MTSVENLTPEQLRAMDRSGPDWTVRTEPNPDKTAETKVRALVTCHSLAALENMLDAGPGPEWTRREHSRSSQRPEVGDRVWFGSRDMDHARQLAREGWPEGRDKALALAEPLLAHKAIGRAPGAYLDVAGAYPVCALAAAGDPMNMLNPEPVEDQNKPIISLAINNTYSAAISAAHVMNTGAALLAVVDALESAGARIELWMCRCGRQNDAMVSNLLKLKGAGETLDRDRLAFLIAHPSSQRRLGFAMDEACDLAAHVNWGPGGYGWPGQIPDDLLPEGTVYLPGVQGTPERARATPGAALAHVSKLIDTRLSQAYRDLPAGTKFALGELARTAAGQFRNGAPT